MIRKITLTLFINSILICSCSRNIYVYELPKKATYMNIKYHSGIVPIDPNDTMNIKKNSITERFSVTEIKKEKGVYVITVESDSIQTISNIMTKNDHSYHLSYQIISLETKSTNKYKKIEEGQQYNLTLNPCFEPRPNIVPSTEIVYIFTKGMRIPIRKSTLNIYTSPNLEGLYYINP